MWHLKGLTTPCERQQGGVNESKVTLINITQQSS